MFGDAAVTWCASLLPTRSNRHSIISMSWCSPIRITPLACVLQVTRLPAGVGTWSIVAAGWWWTRRSWMRRRKRASCRRPRCRGSSCCARSENFWARWRARRFRVLGNRSSACVGKRTRALGRVRSGAAACHAGTCRHRLAGDSAHATHRCRRASGTAARRARACAGRWHGTLSVGTHATRRDAARTARTPWHSDAPVLRRAGTRASVVGAPLRGGQPLAGCRERPNPQVYASGCPAHRHSGSAWRTYCTRY